MNRYSGDQYPPDHIRTFRLFGLLILLITAAAGGALVGGTLFLSNKIVDLICISPLIAAVIAAVLFTYAVRWSKIRAQLPVALAGTLMTVVLYIVFWMGGYQQFAEDSKEQIFATYPGTTAEQASQAVENYLYSETEQRGLIGYFLLNLQEGMTVEEHSSTTPQRPVYRDFKTGEMINPNEHHWGSTTTIGYRVLEFATFLTFIIFAGVSQANTPFCKEMNRWLEYKPAGMVPQQRVNEFLQAINQADFHFASTLLQPNVPKPRLEIELARCHAASPEARFLVKASGKQVNVVMHTTIPAHIYEMFSRSGNGSTEGEAYSRGNQF